MIVKNEEKNIEKALSSARDIAFESIVVDTGSSDMTVEIAEKAGAKVVCFEWVNDFAAARNFGIGQATGDWILILDADEFLYPKDAARLSDFLEKMLSDHNEWGRYLAVSCMVVNLNDSGRKMTKSKSVRIFRNIPSIRYTGRIHEQLTIDASAITHAGDFSLMHTGYSESAHNETGKRQRNIALLREELAADPKNMNLKAYLANSLSMGTDEESQSEAEKLFIEILSCPSGECVNAVLKVKLFIFLINKYSNDRGRLPECEEMCRRAIAAFPGAIDFEYLMAEIMSKNGEYKAAWDLLKGCEEKLVNGGDSGDSIMITADPTLLFSQMILTAKILGDIENVVLYSTHVLTIDKTRQSVLGPCIATLLYYGVSETETIGLLSNIYDFNDSDDKNIIAQAAESCGATDFASRIRES